MSKEKSIFGEHLLETDILNIIGLFDQAGIAKLFAGQEANIEVKKPGCVGLFTSGNLYNGDDPRIQSFEFQCIKTEAGQGRIVEHDHGDEGITELIIADENTNYEGLPEQESFSVGKYKIYVIKPGVRHGNNDRPSSGRWISVKFKN